MNIMGQAIGYHSKNSFKPNWLPGLVYFMNYCLLANNQQHHRGQAIFQPSKNLQTFYFANMNDNYLYR